MFINGRLKEPEATKGREATERDLERQTQDPVQTQVTQETDQRNDQEHPQSPNQDQEPERVTGHTFKRADIPTIPMLKVDCYAEEPQVGFI